jgi:CDP-glucose 4,6-dehydratase
LGEGDWAEDRIVPDCVRALAKGNPIEVRAPHSTRPWQFVLDPLFGYLSLASKMKEDPERYAEAWNFGPDHSNAVDVQTLTEKILAAWGKGTWKDISDNKNAPHEAGHLMLDTAKSMVKLGWKPVYDIDDAIQKTMEWYRNYYSGKNDMYDFSFQQIESYMKDVMMKQ